MRLRSVEYVFSEVRRTLLRFPFTSIFCAAGCFTGWSMIGVPENRITQILLLSLMFGMTLFYALSLMNERFPLPAPFRPAHVNLAGTLFLAGFFYFFSLKTGLDYADRYAQALFGAFLFVSFAPYLVRGGEEGIWQFNRRLLVRCAVSAVYTLVFFGGITLALQASKKLFGLDMRDSVFQHLWIFAAFIFWPLHFMGGTPSDYAELSADRTYPRGLKLFTQYVLIPLAAVYFAILYVYMGKILFTQEWPEGWVSWLTTSASALGLLTFLLLYPVRDEEGNGWIRSYSRGFCVAALPLLVMLLAALYKRVDQYGLTEHRYFLAVMAFWFAGIFLYFIFSARPRIKYVPISLILVSLAASFGPWGAYSASLTSQTGRLEQLLQKNGLVSGGTAVKSGREADYETRLQISACLDYVIRYHGAEHLRKYFPSDLAAFSGAKAGEWDGNSNLSRDLMSFMGQEYLARWAQAGNSHFSLSSDDSGMDTRGFDLAVRFSLYGGKMEPRNMPPEADGKFRAVFNSEGKKILVFSGKKFRLDLPLKKLEDKLRASVPPSPAPQDFLRAEAENADLRVRAYFSGLSGERKAKGELEFSSLRGFLLIKEKRGR